jgi:hypothetical protein
MKIETEFKDGKWYKNISPSFDKCILQYNSKDKGYCKGYWRGYWGIAYSFNMSDDYVLATKEDLAALGTEWEEYWVEESYTIKDLSEGKVAVINDGSVEDMVSLLAVAFPKDKYNLAQAKRFVNQNPSEFYEAHRHTIGNWFSYSSTDLPKQSVKLFLEELNADSPLVAKFMEELDQVPYMREFGTGATRNTDDGKLDFEGFLSPLALEEFAKYMHTNRIQADGKLRDSDNWQKGIPMEAYMKSMYRHFFDTWKSYRGLETPEDQITNLCGLMFNVQGMLHELLKKK